MSRESMVRIGLWTLLAAGWGLFGTLLFIVHGEATEASKSAHDVERLMTNEYVKESDLDKRLTAMEKTQDEMKDDIKTLLKLHMGR